MVCQIELMTESASDTRELSRELLKIVDAPDQHALLLEFDPPPPLPPTTLLEAAAQGEYDLVAQLMLNASEQERKQAMAAASAADHWESVALLQKTRT